MTPLTRRLRPEDTGRFMIAVAATGVVLSLAVMVVGWRLLGRVDAAAGDTLELTAEALVTLEDTVVVADEVVGSTVAALEILELSLVELSATVSASQPLVERLADLGDDVSPRLEAATSTLHSLAGVASTVDEILEAISALPLVPDYEPATPLGDQFTQLADDIEPLADTLRDAAAELDELATHSAALQRDVADLAAAVASVRDDLARSEVVLSEYHATAREARELTEATSAGLATDLTAARVLVVLVGLVLAAM